MLSKSDIFLTFFGDLAYALFLTCTTFGSHQKSAFRKVMLTFPPFLEMFYQATQKNGDETNRARQI